MILLDTHVLVWLLSDEQQLGNQTRQMIDQAWSSNEAAVSAISFWEVAMLQDKGRLVLTPDLMAWRTGLLDDGLIELPVTGQIGIQAVSLEDFHNDPADRLIVATALSGHQLVTVDTKILDWPGSINAVDART